MFFSFYFFHEKDKKKKVMVGCYYRMWRRENYA
jgi:hypothetical protein